MNICFIGGGNMANAMIMGLLKNNFKATQLRAVDINALVLKALGGVGVRVTSNLAEGIAGSDVIVLAVKPQQLREVATQLAPLLHGQLILSIAAGIRATDLSRWLDTQNIVRAMPNTPALIRSGMTGLYALPEVSQTHQEHAKRILMAVGETLWVQDESLLDAVTAISGSGPAYVFYFMEAMQLAAQELGFDSDSARDLSISTFLGAAKLADDSVEDVSVLRARVTSKNGTTERALLSMEANRVKEHIIAAAKAAAARAKEMGDELGAA